MRAEIIEEHDDWIGVEVVDNSGVTHQISVDKSSGIDGHSHDEYPETQTERTDRQGEHISQARRYAQWFLYRERGYETMEPWENHDRIASVGGTVLTCEEAELREFFGDTYDQLRCHYHSDVDPVVPIPNGHEDGSGLFYTQDVALAGSLEQRGEEFLELFGEELATALSSLPTPNLVDKFAGLFRSTPKVESPPEDFAEEFGRELTGVTEFEAVSGIDVTYVDGPNSRTTIQSDDRIDGPVDARLELFPVDFDTIEGFRAFLLLHLVCQLRDVFVGMGVEPPEAYRYLGPGKPLFTAKYEDFDFYEPYHDTRADIEGYDLPFQL